LIWVGILRLIMETGECMSYMDHNTAFAPAGGIQEMSFQEVDQVGGGALPALVVLGAKLVGYGIAAAAGTATGVAIAKAASELAKAIDD